MQFLCPYACTSLHLGEVQGARLAPGGASLLTRAPQPTLHTRTKLSAHVKFTTPGWIVPTWTVGKYNILQIYCNTLYYQYNILQYSPPPIQYIAIFSTTNTIYCNILRHQYNILVKIYCNIFFTNLFLRSLGTEVSVFQLQCHSYLTTGATSGVLQMYIIPEAISDTLFQ